MGVKVGRNVTHSAMFPIQAKTTCTAWLWRRGGLVRAAFVGPQKSHDQRGIPDLSITKSRRTTNLSADPLRGRIFGE